MVRASVSAPTISTAPKQHRGRQQQAVRGPDHQPQQMRHHDADKSDDAANRNRDAGHRRHQHDRNPLQPLDVDAAVERLGLAEHQHVEPARDRQAGDQGDPQHRRQRGKLGPGRSAQRAQQPERDVAQLAIVGDEHQKPDAGIGDRGDRNSRQQEDRNRGPARAARDSIEDDGRRQRARESCDRQQLVLHEAKALADLAVGEDDRCRSRERAAGGNADQRGIGEGISKQPLHDRAGCREQPAHHGGGGDPRNPDRPQHELVAREIWTGRASVQRPSAAGSRASGIPAAPTVSAISATPTSAISRPARVSDAAGRNAYPLRRFALSARESASVGHCRQFAVSAAGVNFSACGASAG